MTAFAATKKGEDQNVRSVQGTVFDANDAPVSGAVVQLKNTRTLQIRSFVTKENGAYYFHGLSPDVDYELKADNNQGASSPTKTLSSFDSRKEAVINLKLSKK
jgi:protocatechuate 3,4-dioxygenase beta subunit